ncbi:MAG: NADH pyrophosphatase NudC (nudix superfamily) [Candidatus Azotimanducaceae bacterium]|jgi:NADH pyrophosphatase NudC (nudix superfamily)
MNKFKFCPLCAAPLAEIEIATGPRIECSASCGYVNYDNPTPVAAVVVEYEGQMLLAHNRSWPGSFCSVITGFVDHGESPHEAAVREVKEELNLEATEPTLISVYPFARMNQVIIGYHVKANGNIVLNEELDSYKLLTPEECVVWPTATGFIFRDWLLSQKIEPEMVDLRLRRKADIE